MDSSHDEGNTEIDLVPLCAVGKHTEILSRLLELRTAFCAPREECREVVLVPFICPPFWLPFVSLECGIFRLPAGL